MHNVLYLLLRRARLPLIVVICAYAFSILGFVLIPGMDDQGNPWQMDFFHAFYFVSFMGSTIGFGEIPYPFTDAQRAWTIVTIYSTVIAWLYALGAIFSALQAPAFQRLLSFASFSRNVKRINDPFYLVCGYGDAGSLLIGELAERGIQSVVIDADQQRIHGLHVADLKEFVPGLCGDASDSRVLIAAGLRHPDCAGVLALTDKDSINLTIAITSKLLVPRLRVICRAETHDAGVNMASFGTDFVVNPYDTFARRFALMFRSPSLYLVFEWMTSIWLKPLTEFQRPPQGKWVLCGYGRFGKAIMERLQPLGIEFIIIEADPHGTQSPVNTVVGRGTEAETLHRAQIEDAVGVIAGTDDDANNLSILLTAREINENLFLVARQNKRSNDEIFAAANADLVMQPGTIIGQRILSLIMTPLLGDFLDQARVQSEQWANVLVSRVVGVMSDRPPDIWAINITAEETPAVADFLLGGREVTVSQLCTDPRGNTCPLPCVSLLLRRGDERILLPDVETPVQLGDELLFCGLKDAEAHMRWTAVNHSALSFVRTGEDRPSGYLWRWLSGAHRDDAKEGG